MDTWTPQQRALIVELYFRNDCSIACAQLEFHRRCDVKVPTDRAIRRWIENFRKSGSVTDGKRAYLPKSVSTVGNVATVQKDVHRIIEKDIPGTCNRAHDISESPKELLVPPELFHLPHCKEESGLPQTVVSSPSQLVEDTNTTMSDDPYKDFVIFYRDYEKAGRPDYLTLMDSGSFSAYEIEFYLNKTQTMYNHEYSPLIKGIPDQFPSAIGRGKIDAENKASKLALEILSRRCYTIKCKKSEPITLKDIIDSNLSSSNSSISQSPMTSQPPQNNSMIKKISFTSPLLTNPMSTSPTNTVNRTMEDIKVPPTMNFVGVNTTMKDMKVPPTMNFAGVNRTMKDMKIPPTMNFARVNRTMDDMNFAGVNRTMEDMKVPPTMNFAGVDKTMEDMIVPPTMNFAGVNSIMEDMNVPPTMNFSGDICSWMERNPVQSLYESRSTSSSTNNNSAVQQSMVNQFTVNQPTVSHFENSFGKKMLERMGWSGGGLGKDGHGITEPIKSAQIAGRYGLGHQKRKESEESTTQVKNVKKKAVSLVSLKQNVNRNQRRKKEPKKQPPCPVKEIVDTRLEDGVHRVIDNFIKKSEDRELVFSRGLTNHHRKIIHTIAQTYELSSISFGLRKTRHLVLFKEDNTEEFLENIKNNKSGYYEVIPPENDQPLVTS